MVSTASAKLSWQQLRKNHRKTSDVVKMCGFYEPPVDVHRIATMLGISVREVSSPGWSGACQCNPEKREATIWIRAEDHRLRKRFTLAHEIGHIVLHKPGIAYRDIEFDGSIEERQANGYAAGLLMPEFMVTPRLSAYGTDILGLSRLFDVSEGSMRFRLVNLYV